MLRNPSMTLLSLNLRRIAYYAPYNRQVLLTHRNTVRLNHKLTAEEDMQRKKSYQHGELRLTRKCSKRKEPYDEGPPRMSTKRMK
jgi:hypothetical protein